MAAQRECGNVVRGYRQYDGDPGAVAASASTGSTGAVARERVGWALIARSALRPRQRGVRADA
eukprot:3296057-Prymnesium_polylepis.1